MRQSLSAPRHLPLGTLAGFLSAALVGCIPYGNTLCFECAEDDEECKMNACSNYTETGTGSESTTTTGTTLTTTESTMTTESTTTGTSTSTTEDTSTTDTSTTTSELPCSYDLICDADETVEGCLHDCGLCEVDGVCDNASETPYACPEDCQATECDANGEIDALTEQCDDGNANDEDACTNACAFNLCGDGFLFPEGEGGTEECDDGNDVIGDGCAPDCTIERRLVFVSSTEFKGDLGPAIDALSGLELADAQCQKLADAAGKAGTFRAWLSDGESGPSTRFGVDSGFSGVFELADGSVIANGWADLVDGELGHPINVDENGATDQTSVVWTNCDSDGTPLGSAHCQGWTVIGGIGDKGHFGFSGESAATWTDLDTQFCASSARLYCFQVE